MSCVQIRHLFGGLLDSFQIGAITKTKSWLEIWKFPPHLHPVGRGERRALVNNWSCLCEKASMQSLKYRVQRTSGLMNNISRCWREIHPSSMGTKASVLRRLLDLYLCMDFILVFICIFYNIHCNKLVNISRCFPEFCELFQQITERKQWEAVGTSDIVARLDRNVSTLRTRFVIGIWSRTPLWDWAIKIVESYSTSGVMLNYIIEHSVGILRVGKLAGVGEKPTHLML